MLTEDDSKRQDNAFAMLKDEFSRLEEMDKTLRKTVGLPEAGEFVLNEADMTPEIRKALEEAKAKAKSDGAARAAQFKAEDDSKRQDNAFAMLKDEFARLEEMDKTLRKAVGLPEDGEFVLNEADMTPEIRKALEEAKAKAKSEGAARAAQFKAASSA